LQLLLSFWPYIQSIRLNGKPLNLVRFRHADVVNGATLELQMGYTPNEKLGSDPASFRPRKWRLGRLILKGLIELNQPHDISRATG
jgi:hypothetical protein